MIRVLVCGGRDWEDELAVELALNCLNELHGIECIVHGAARGADTLAMQWANRRGVKHRPFPANWDAHGLGAGRRRNRQMLREAEPDLVVAFPGGSGTLDMIEISEKAGIPVLKFGGWSWPGDLEPDGVMLAL